MYALLSSGPETEEDVCKLCDDSSSGADVLILRIEGPDV